jgi:hypothetical protein
MSDHTDDRRPPSAGGPHPDDALAGYVDGTATLAERRAVDSHLASCGACRSDLERARSARAVLGALPEIDPPAMLLPTGDLETPASGKPAGTMESTGRGVLTPLRGRRGGDAWGKAMGGLVAAAAVVAVILGSVVLFHGGGGHTAATGAGSDAGGPVAESPTPARDYTAASLDALAASIARTPPKTDAVPSPSEGSDGTAGAPLAKAIEDCTRRATKATGPPILLLSGTFKGRPADIAVFRETDADSSLVVVVAAHPHTCRALYVASARAAATSP